MIFDRLSRYLGFSKFGAPLQPSQQSRSPISMVLTMSLLPWQHGEAIKPAYFSHKIVFI
jgi:hypothetical protein